MKRRIRTVGALGAAGALLLSGVGVTVANAAGATFVADAYAVGDDEQVTDASEFLFDSRKGDSPADAYQLAYRGTLELSQVWEEYNSLRGLGVVLFGGEAGWRAKTFLGTWDASFTLDQSVVSVDESQLTCESVQAEFLSQNAEGSAGNILQCSDTGFDPATGTVSIQFSMIGPSGESVTGADLDTASNEPPQVRIATPPGALYVTQSAFEAGASFAMTEPTAIGEMRMDDPLGGNFPVEFDDIGAPVSLEMVPTFDAVYSFASATDGEELPQAVLDLLPDSTFMLRDGAEVTASDPAALTVAEGDGSWIFRGWDVQSTTVAGANIAFVGNWEFDTDGGGGDEVDDVFGVTYNFQAADADADGNLPDAVLALLPSTDEKFAPGETVVPVQPSTSQIVETRDDADAGVRTVTTWDFEGWDAESIEVADSDVVFTGTWSKTVTEEPLVVVETFGVSYVFRAADGVEATLPESVLTLLPQSDARFESGDTVTPITLSETQVIETVDDEQESTRTVTTWEFEGWDPESAEVVDSDVTFTGAWSMSAETLPLTPDPDPTPDPTPEPAPDPTPDPEPAPDPTPTPGPGDDTKKPLSETGGASPELFVIGGSLLLLAGTALVLRHMRRQARDLGTL